MGGGTVYRVALKQSSGSSLAVHNHTADVRVTLDRTVTLVLVPVGISTSKSGIHTTTYVVNGYVPQIRVYVRSKHISTCVLVSMIE